MNIKEIAEQIDLLENEVKRKTQTYLNDIDYITIIDAQLNGYAKSVQTYCDLNKLYSFSKNIENILPIENSAIEFFCLWGGLKNDIVNHSQLLQGQKKVDVVNKIASKLQTIMTYSQINTFLNSFSINTPDTSSNYGSKRLYVEEVLRNADGIVIMNIAEDLSIISSDIIETDITNKLTSEFVKQQISKCIEKMKSEDYDGAITNARTLIEEILLNIEEKIEGERKSYDGKLPQLYKRVTKQINMYPDDSGVDNSFNEILRGYISVINGFSGLSNNIADRHATPIHPKKHHAKIVVNSSMILSEFLIDSFEYQQNRQI